MVSSILSRSRSPRDPTCDYLNVDRLEDPTDFKSDILARLFSYWRGKVRNGTLPARAMIDPIEIPTLLPYIILIDVHGDPFDLYYRLAGTAVVAKLGYEVRGMAVRALPVSDATALFDAYALTARDGVPRRIDAVLSTRYDRLLRIQRIVMPLAADGIMPDMLFVGAVYEDA